MRERLPDYPPEFDDVTDDDLIAEGVDAMAANANETARENGFHGNRNEIVDRALAGVALSHIALSARLERFRREPGAAEADAFAGCGGPHGDRRELVLAFLALVHSEVSEAAQAWLDGNVADVVEELADVVIRVGDTVEELAKIYPELDVSLGRAVVEKQMRNRERPVRHGGKRA